jgi:hypothetical protein
LKNALLRQRIFFAGSPHGTTQADAEADEYSDAQLKRVRPLLGVRRKLVR